MIYNINEKEIDKFCKRVIKGKIEIKQNQKYLNDFIIITKENENIIISDEFETPNDILKYSDKIIFEKIYRNDNTIDKIQIQQNGFKITTNFYNIKNKKIAQFTIILQQN